jgi:hypothetical protein
MSSHELQMGVHREADVANFQHTVQTDSCGQLGGCKPDLLASEAKRKS